MTDGSALWADYWALRKNLRRLCQVADIRYKRHYLHAERCAACQDEDGDGCREGLQLYSYALGFDVAVAILKGER